MKECDDQGIGRLFNAAKEGFHRPVTCYDFILDNPN